MRSIVLTVVLLLAIVIPGRALHAAAAGSCPDLPYSDDLQSRLVNTQIFNLMLQTNSRYAGDLPNPPPIPQYTFMDGVHRSEVGGPLPEIRKTYPDAMFYPLFSSQFQSDDRDVIVFSPEVIWCLLRPHSMVLLTDNATSHWTIIFHIDREKNLIVLNDTWPDGIFLREGYNLAGVKAKFVDRIFLPGRKLVQITKDEFLRVFVGAQQIDTLDLIQRYDLITPKHNWPAGVYTAFAGVLLRSRMDRLAPVAAEFLKEGLRRAESSHDPDLAQFAAGRLYVALQINRFRYLEKGDMKRFNEAGAASSSLLATYNSLPTAQLQALDATRIGYAAGSCSVEDTTPEDMRQFCLSSAFMFFSAAIGKDPKFTDAYKFRLSVRLQMMMRSPNPLEDMPAARASILSDLGKIIGVAEEARPPLENTKRNPKNVIYSIRGQEGVNIDANMLDQVNKDEMFALKVRGKLLAGERPGDALTDAIRAIKIDENDPEAYEIAAQCERALGHMPESQTYLDKARELRTRNSQTPIPNPTSDDDKPFVTMQNLLDQASRSTDRKP